MSRPDRRPTFLPLGETQLYALEDLELVRHVQAAKAAGRVDQAELAIHMLLYKHQPVMRRRVALRLPPHLAHHAETVAEWVLTRVTASALAFEGASVGEWVNWYTVAITRQVISFWRTSEGQQLEREVPLPSEDGEGHDRLGTALDVDRLVAQVCYEEIVQTVLDGLGNAMHVDAVRLAFWDQLPSAQVAARCGTSAANVDQIKSRFKRALREECLRRGIAKP